MFPWDAYDIHELTLGVKQRTCNAQPGCLLSSYRRVQFPEKTLLRRERKSRNVRVASRETVGGRS